MTLLEIKRKHLDLYLEIRPLMAREAKNELSDLEKKHLYRLMKETSTLQEQVPEAELSEIEKIFGKEVAQKWIERRDLLSKPIATGMVGADRLKTLNKELKQAIDYINNIR